MTRDFPQPLKLLNDLVSPVGPLIKGTLSNCASTVVYACHCAEGEGKEPLYLERGRPVPPAPAALDEVSTRRVCAMLDELVRPWAEPLARSNFATRTHR